VSSDPEKTAKLEDLLNSAWREYRGDIQERLDAVRNACAMAQTGSLTDEFRAQANSAAHKLAGVLGTFGLKDASRIALEIETMLAPGAPLNPQQLVRFEEQLALIVQGIESRDRQALE